MQVHNPSFLACRKLGSAAGGFLKDSGPFPGIACFSRAKEIHMALLAYYDVLRDGVFTIPAFNPSPVTLNFNPTDDIVLEDPLKHHPVLSYRVDPEAAQDLEFTVSVRTIQGIDRVVSSFKLDGTVSRTVFEPVDPSFLEKGNNPIIFKYISGEGNLHFSDVIMWYKRDRPNA
jgi:hypothetical protein